MTNPAVKTEMINGLRHYVHPITGEKVPSVTSVLGVINKPALPRWSAKKVAEYAWSNRATWGALDEKAAIDLLKGAPWRDMDRAADAGTSVHDVADRLLSGRPVEFVQPGTEASIASVAEMIQQFHIAPLLSEVTIWNSTIGYAGTFDAMVLIDGQKWLLDWKSGNSVYPEQALQLAAYGMAEQVVLADGTVHDFPGVDAYGIAHVPKTGNWSLYQVQITDAERDAFTAAHALLRWQNTRSKDVLAARLRKPAVPAQRTGN